MPALDSQLRGSLEKTILDARTAAEAAAAVALNVLAVDRDAPFASMDESARNLRLALRARARALGAGVLAAGLGQLVEEVAYEQWHRMLFARFLAENGLLRHPAGVSVTLEECAELAAEEGEPDAWAIAAKYAAAMLPGIFRNDDPAVRIRLAPEGRAALEQQLRKLPHPLFTADDGLGWVYQFWQVQKKNEVNASREKLGGAAIAAYTQLFTEDYMVRFLLENSLGAWWAARHPKSPLLKHWMYLRYRDDGTPAAGAFPGWPERAAEITVMDPCCGSGHFLVVAFVMLLQMRMEEEGLDEAATADAVLRDNVFGLELDPRCTQIAVFALALAAWKFGGYHALPEMNLACSGIAVQGQLNDWLRLAGNDTRLRYSLEQLHTLFKDAPTLGSLIDPRQIKGSLLAAEFGQVVALLEKALAGDPAQDPATAVLSAAATGAAAAAVLLAGQYTLIATNVPYLASSKQTEILSNFSQIYHPDAADNLASTFLERCRGLTQVDSSLALVTPQNWYNQLSYADMRRNLLSTMTWQMIGMLGKSAFTGMNWWAADTVLTIFTSCRPDMHSSVSFIDVSDCKKPEDKAVGLKHRELGRFLQLEELNNPDYRIAMGRNVSGTLLQQYAEGLQGVKTGDDERFRRRFWENDGRYSHWKQYQSTINEPAEFGGLHYVLNWTLSGANMARLQGQKAWGKAGVAISAMNRLLPALYLGGPFDSNVAVILPRQAKHLAAIWAYCRSEEFYRDVRRLDVQTKVPNATLVKVAFDLERWQKVAAEQYPNGLPKPYSNDLTQWLFKGTVTDTTEPLHVAVARLLGYAWPDQVNDGLSQYAAEDGSLPLVPLPSVRSGAERLRTLLAAAYGAGWSAATQETLLAGSGYASKSLEAWLRDGFFEQHCRIFHNRPFLWQVWDGRPDGFSVIVNYHRLDGALLDKLTYTYLGAWIEQQRTAAGRGEAGADGRLVAALALQEKLKRIREGEPPYDIYVRWKPLHKQPLGWEPDLDDGVRLNIRPFVEAGVLRRKFTINWNTDRGTNPDGSERLNDLHYTLDEKRRARAAAGVSA